MILLNNGYLLCRVNSTRDFNHGAGQGEEIESNYYCNNNCYKRFFDSKMIDELFSEKRKMVEKKEYSLDRYSKPKILWEVAVMKI